MKNSDYPSNEGTSMNPDQDIEPTERRYEDRRKELKEGFTYVSMVGWICRREQLRRKDDTCDCNL
jgi:hypothetical protein